MWGRALRVFRFETAILVVFMLSCLFALIRKYISFDADVAQGLSVVASVLLFLQTFWAKASATLVRVPFVRKVLPALGVVLASICGGIVGFVLEHSLHSEQGAINSAGHSDLMGCVFLLQMAIAAWWWNRGLPPGSPRITFFRSFSTQVGVSVMRETARTLAAVGQLRIVNDGASFDLDEPLFLGAYAFQAVSPQDQVFLNQTNGKKGVAILIRESDLFVIDVTIVTPGLKWEIARVFEHSSTPTMFIAERGMPDYGGLSDEDDPSVQGASVNGGRLSIGGLTRPVSYSGAYWARIRFRFAVLRWLDHHCG